MSILYERSGSSLDPAFQRKDCLISAYCYHSHKIWPQERVQLMNILSLLEKLALSASYDIHMLESLNVSEEVRNAFATNDVNALKNMISNARLPNESHVFAVI